MGSISLSTPSFEIRGASGAPSSPRWDRIDSRSLIAKARRIYFAYLSCTPAGTPAGQEPLGVVVDPQEPDGRVVFETPVLLPDEEFIAIDLIRGRTSRGRTRWKG